ncbi:MAG TPA: TetR/AcrR family transcriptional regulator C-terminal domain-containing protein [Steroidobacteraceae bacterium]|nr:TetR/AcrR family transcriptional regulator C-terminal domain-containing protein [Steroidobacteraceae bacterium]
MRVGREPVARAGLKLLDEVGLEGLTLRAIGAELGVRAPTLYWRFRNKQDLVDEMASRVLADFAAALLAAKPLPATWPEWTRCSAQRFRAELLRYRDGARMVAGTFLQDTTVYAVMETALSIFVAAKITPDVAAVFLKTVNDYVVGFTIEQQAVVSPAGERDPRYAAEVRDARMDPARYPLARSISASLFKDYDEVFKRGLDIIIAGFAADLPRSGKAWRDFRQTLPANR